VPKKCDKKTIFSSTRLFVTIPVLVSYSTLGVVYVRESDMFKYVLEDDESNGILCLTLRLVWDVPASSKVEHRIGVIRRCLLNNIGVLRRCLRLELSVVLKHIPILCHRHTDHKVTFMKMSLTMSTICHLRIAVSMMTSLLLTFRSICPCRPLETYALQYFVRHIILSMTTISKSSANSASVLCESKLRLRWALAW
jgi:hypothetical protein